MQAIRVGLWVGMPSSDVPVMVSIVSMRVGWVGSECYPVLEGVVSMADPCSLEVRVMSLPGDVWEV